MSDLLEQMRRNPQGDWTIGDVQRLCAEHGLTCLAPTRGSHYKISRPGHSSILTIPLNAQSNQYIFAIWSVSSAARRRSRDEGLRLRGDRAAPLG